MLRVRLAQTADLDGLMSLLNNASNGLYSLPANPDILMDKIAVSEKSMATCVTHPGGEYYFFVLIDEEKKALVGCAAIKAQAGYHSPYYLYRLSELKRQSPTLKCQQVIEVLELNNDFDRESEVCSLYLHPAYRQQSYGRLLSYARLLFIALYPERFGERIFADIRGCTDKSGQSPFWEYLIKPFIPLSYHEEETLMALDKRTFIMDLLPTFPIYKKLLPHVVQETIGKAHEGSAGAKNLLEKACFHFHDYINILDGGPTMSAYKTDLSLAHQCYNIQRVAEIRKPLCEGILGRTSLPFSAVYTPFTLIDKQVTLFPETAEILAVKEGEQLIFRE